MQECDHPGASVCCDVNEYACTHNDHHLVVVVVFIRGERPRFEVGEFGELAVDGRQQSLAEVVDRLLELVPQTVLLVVEEHRERGASHLRTKVGTKGLVVKYLTECQNSQVYVHRFKVLFMSC